MTTTEKLQLIDLLQKYQHDLLDSDKKNAELRNQIKLSNSWDEKDIQYNICIHYNIKNQPYDISEDKLPPEWKNPDARIYYMTIVDENGHVRPAEYFGDFVKNTYVNTGYTNWWPHSTNYEPRYVSLTDMLKYFTPVYRTRYLANGEFFSKGSY